jgi:hypothetical protein
MHHNFLTHGVPNTPQLKPTEDNCEEYFTPHVSNVTLCRCQIYSVARGELFCGLTQRRRKKQYSESHFPHFLASPGPNNELYPFAIGPP